MISMKALAPAELGAKAFIEITRARFESARGYFARATEGPRGKVTLDPALVLFEWLSRVVADSYEPLEEQAGRERQAWPVAARALEKLTEARTKGGGAPFTHSFEGRALEGIGWIDVLFAGLAARWTDGSAPAPAGVRERLRDQGYDFVVRELDALASDHPQAPALVLAWTRRAPWERALRALEQAASTVPGESDAPAEGDIVWEIDVDNWPPIALTARLVSDRARKGKVVSIDRLESDRTLPLEPRDRLVVLEMVAAKARRTALPASALLHLVGDLRVRDPRGTTLVVAERPSRVRVEHDAAGFRVSLAPVRFDASGVAVVREHDTIVVTRRTEVAERIANV
ncbi:hypothetical protein EON77_20455, partial [bacterium]